MHSTGHVIPKRWTLRIIFVVHGFCIACAIAYATLAAIDHDWANTAGNAAGVVFLAWNLNEVAKVRYDPEQSIYGR